MPTNDSNKSGNQTRQGSNKDQLNQGSSQGLNKGDRSKQASGNPDSDKSSLSGKDQSGKSGSSGSSGSQKDRNQ